MSTPFLELKDLKKSFTAGEYVLQGINLTIEKGEFVTLLGASGCGKTTTLRIIAGLEQPDSGSVWLEGRDVTALEPNQRDVNTVFQNYALFPHMNVEDNIGYGLKIRKVPKARIREKVKEMLELVQLESYEKRKPSELSGGQKQRVAIARALANNPKVLLLDEPLGALDLQLRRAMQVELKRLQKKLGITFIYITHDQEEAINMSDRIVVMNQGHFEQIGTPDEIYDHPQTSYVASFVGNANILRGTVEETTEVNTEGNRERNTEKYTERNTEKYTERNTEKYTERNTEKYTERNTEENTKESLEEPIEKPIEKPTGKADIYQLKIRISGGTVFVRTKEKITPGNPVTLAVRSEKIQLSDVIDKTDAADKKKVTDKKKITGRMDIADKTDDAISLKTEGNRVFQKVCLPAVVKEKNFTAGQQKVLLTLPDGTTVTASRFGMNANIQPGQQISWCFEPEDAVVVDRNSEPEDAAVEKNSEKDMELHSVHPAAGEKMTGEKC